jgi:hypothetical protein
MLIVSAPNWNPVAKQYDKIIATVTIKSGIAVDRKPVPTPAIITVAGPVSLDLAILIVGL